jgi:hypothetical protein
VPPVSHRTRFHPTSPPRLALLDLIGVCLPLRLVRLPFLFQGDTIAIRLRRVRSDDSFFDFHHVLGTMLHELCHIVHGPHNDKFYALLDELWGEAEALMDKGVFGLGPFESTGYRAGGILKSQADAREAQVQAALKRQRLGALMGGPSSGKRLGGSRVGKDVRALAAEAAERRAADDVWCQDMVAHDPGAGQSARASSQNPAPPAPHPAGRAGAPAKASTLCGDGASGRKGTASAGEGSSRKRKSSESRDPAGGGPTRDRDKDAATRRGGGGGKLIDLTLDDDEDVVAGEGADDCVVVEVTESGEGACVGASQSTSSSSRAQRRGKRGAQPEGLRCPRCGHSNPFASLIPQSADAPLCSSCGAMLWRD